VSASTFRARPTLTVGAGAAEPAASKEKTPRVTEVEIASSCRRGERPGRHIRRAEGKESRCLPAAPR
jgi:hypothetical protein